MTKTIQILDALDDFTEPKEDIIPDTKQMGLILKWDNYWGIKKLAAKASEAKGEHVSIREYMETILITPHIASARKAGLID